MHEEDDITGPSSEEAVLEERAARRRAEQAVADGKRFNRLRLNVTAVSPGYVSASLFQSDNHGVNWGCVGTDLTFPEDWWAATISGAAEVGQRFEFEIMNIHGVTA